MELRIQLKIDFILGLCILLTTFYMHVSEDNNSEPGITLFLRVWELDFAFKAIACSPFAVP